MPRADNPMLQPRIGIPYRTHKEELSGAQAKYDLYVQSVQKAGGMPIEISLRLSPAELQKVARELDGIVLPGSPADVNPARYRAARRTESADADEAREQTDLALLEHCVGEGKPILAICYGVQILNVYFGGSLVQDIAAEMPGSAQHAWEGRERGVAEPFHGIAIERGTKVALAAGRTEARVNSSHHQAVRELGQDLRVAARATDGIIEAVEWTGDQNWITGVQWHPERMAADRLSEELFRNLIAAAWRIPIRA